MSELQAAGFEIVNCPECGTANSVGNDICRKCGADMNKAREVLIPMWAVGATVGVILLFVLFVMLSVLFDAGIYIAVPLIFIGLVMAVVGNIWFLVVAFREDVMWGLGCIFLPFVSLIFLIKYMDKAAKPFSLSIIGVFLIVVTGFLGSML